ncbi:MAG TPA: carbohydrate kinase family protein [Anaerolineales bacterium]|nr:carbohydrate kinase family protein [Anaerolineales bacterium]
MKFLISGSVAYDYLMTFPGHFHEQILPERLQNISLSFLVDNMTRQRGGIAPNIAYTMALLGQKPKLFATVGEDFEEYRAWLEKYGVDTEWAKVIPGKFTASFFATTDKNNAQIASFYPGAMGDAANLSLKELTERPDLVIISPTDPAAMKKHAAECREMEIPYLYDPSQQVLRLEGSELERDLSGAHFMFVNDYEIGLIKKKTGLGMPELLQKVNIIVVTKGAEGAVIYSQDKEIFIPVIKEERVVDPTGVGDAFRGGFLSGYAHGWDLEFCARIGSLAAVYCLEQNGTQNHHYTVEEFKSRFRNNFDDDGRLEALSK